MNLRLLGTIVRIIIQGLIAVTGLVLMVVFAQHQHDAALAMGYINIWCVPVLAVFTVLVNSIAIRKYLYPELEESEPEHAR